MHKTETFTDRKIHREWIFCKIFSGKNFLNKTHFHVNHLFQCYKRKYDCTVYFYKSSFYEIRLYDHSSVIFCPSFLVNEKKIFGELSQIFGEFHPNLKIKIMDFSFYSLMHFPLSLFHTNVHMFQSVDLCQQILNLFKLTFCQSIKTCE